MYVRFTLSTRIRGLEIVLQVTSLLDKMGFFSSSVSRCNSAWLAGRIQMRLTQTDLLRSKRDEGPILI